MVLVNCGCGSKYSKKWMNIDYNGDKRYVIQHNLTEGIPLDDGTVDFIYNSHFLEHLTLAQANYFLSECYRTLKKGGVLRIVVPDMENIAREYLKILERVKSNATDTDACSKYDYIMIEMIDQMTRTKCGGLLGEYWKDKNGNREYVIQRHGNVYAKTRKSQNSTQKDNTIISDLKEKINEYMKRFTFYKMYNDGKFLNSGERHMWMYDIYGMKKNLYRAGFTKINQCTYNNSSLEKFASYKLEVDAEGNEYKPNSLYVEAMK